MCVLELFVAPDRPKCKFSIKAICAEEKCLCRTLESALDNSKEKYSTKYSV